MFRNIFRKEDARGAGRVPCLPRTATDGDSPTGSRGRGSQSGRPASSRFGNSGHCHPPARDRRTTTERRYGVEGGGCSGPLRDPRITGARGNPLAHRLIRSSRARLGQETAEAEDRHRTRRRPNRRQGRRGSRACCASTRLPMRPHRRSGQPRRIPHSGEALFRPDGTARTHRSGPRSAVSVVTGNPACRDAQSSPSPTKHRTRPRSGAGRTVFSGRSSRTCG